MRVPSTNVPAADIVRHLVTTRFGTIHCIEAGTGPAIVMTHINQQSSALMTRLIDASAPAFRVVAIDYPSHGMSDHIDSQPTIDDYAECVIAVMDALAIDSACALGEATGAAVSIALAVGHPDRIERCVLINCPYYRDRSHARQVHGELKDNLRPSDDSGFPLTRTIDFMTTTDPGHAPLVIDQEWMDRINRAQMEAGRHRWQALDALNAFDIRAGFERLEQPTLIIMGEHFHYTHLLPDYLDLITGPAAGHVLKDARFGAAWEKPREIAGLVRDFFTARSASRA